MIEINLLPEQYRKKKKSFSVQFQFSKYKTHIGKFIAVPLIVLVLGVLMLVVYPVLQSRTLKKLEVRWGNIEKSYTEVDKLKKEQKRLQGLLDGIKRIIKESIVWSKMLNIISDCLSAEIQLTELRCYTCYGKEVKDKTEMCALAITGVVPLYPGEKAIGEFIKLLAENKDFVKVFSDIEPPSTETTPEGFKKFTFKCYMTGSRKKPKEETAKKKNAGK